MIAAATPRMTVVRKSIEIDSKCVKDGPLYSPRGFYKGQLQVTDPPAHQVLGGGTDRGPPPAVPHECDVVLKGGITSGVVYPKALWVLSERYRFRNIGGASAGAIAAV